MARKKISTIIEEKINPFTLNEKGKSGIDLLTKKYSYDFLVECIDIGVSTYFRYDDNGKLTHESVNDFLNKLGGIAFNKMQSPIDQEISHLVNYGKTIFYYWDKYRATEIIKRYVNALQMYWKDDEIIKDLKGNTLLLMNDSYNWSQWVSNMEGWINDVKNWSEQKL